MSLLEDEVEDMMEVVWFPDYLLDVVGHGGGWEPVDDGPGEAT
jgi:hypothetical protein